MTINIVPDQYIEKVVSLYAYQGQQTDELTFNENTTIYVQQKSNDGWWDGITESGQRGLFPANYVTKIE
ncbi:hypothetical protein ACOME3_004531 [Neoechinorhynchus agilis]